MPVRFLHTTLYIIAMYSSAITLSCMLTFCGIRKHCLPSKKVKESMNSLWRHRQRPLLARFPDSRDGVRNLTPADLRGQRSSDRHLSK